MEQCKCLNELLILLMSVRTLARCIERAARRQAYLCRVLQPSKLSHLCLLVCHRGWALMAMATLLLAACTSSSAASTPMGNRKLLQTDVIITQSAARITPNGQVTTTGDAGAWGSGAAGSRMITIERAVTDRQTGEVTSLSSNTVGTSHSTPGAGSYATVNTAQQTDNLLLANTATIASENGGSAQLTSGGFASNGEYPILGHLGCQHMSCLDSAGGTQLQHELCTSTHTVWAF